MTSFYRWQIVRNVNLAVVLHIVPILRMSRATTYIRTVPCVFTARYFTKQTDNYNCYRKYFVNDFDTYQSAIWMTAAQGSDVLPQPVQVLTPEYQVPHPKGHSSSSSFKGNSTILRIQNCWHVRFCPYVRASWRSEASCRLHVCVGQMRGNIRFVMATQWHGITSRNISALRVHASYSYGLGNCTYWFGLGLYLLGAFAKLRKVTIYFVMFIRLSAKTRFTTDGCSRNLTFENFRKSVERI